MQKQTSNLGLNSGVLPDLAMTRSEASALIAENQRRGGRSVTRKSAGEQAMERLQTASAKPPQGTDGLKSPRLSD